MQSLLNAECSSWFLAYNAAIKNSYNNNSLKWIELCKIFIFNICIPTVKKKLLLFKIFGWDIFKWRIN